MDISGAIDQQAQCGPKHRPLRGRRLEIDSDVDDGCVRPSDGCVRPSDGCVRPSDVEEGCVRPCDGCVRPCDVNGVCVTPVNSAKGVCDPERGRVGSEATGVCVTPTSSADEQGGQGSDHEGSKPSDKSKPSRTRQKPQTFDFQTDGANDTSRRKQSKKRKERTKHAMLVKRRSNRMSDTDEIITKLLMHGTVE